MDDNEKKKHCIQRRVEKSFIRMIYDRWMVQISFVIWYSMIPFMGQIKLFVHINTSDCDEIENGKSNRKKKFKWNYVYYPLKFKSMENMNSGPVLDTIFNHFRLYDLLIKHIKIETFVQYKTKKQNSRTILSINRISIHHKPLYTSLGLLNGITDTSSVTKSCQWSIKILGTNSINIFPS